MDYLSVMGQLPDEVRSDLQHHGVVGDLCAHMFDEEGHFVEHEVSRRTLSISIDELRRVPRVVAVAGGLDKAISLLGAVRTGYSEGADYRSAGRRVPVGAGQRREQ